MKRYLLFCLSVITIVSNAATQDFLGVNTGNYAGVTGVMLQPASIVDSRHKFDINIFSTGANFSNNYLLVDRNALLKFNSNNFSDYQTFKNKYLSEAGLAAGEKAFGNISNRTQMPLSFMATLNKKSAIALNIQSRTMMQGRDISSGLAQMAFNGFGYDPTANPVIDASGFNILGLNWAEVGLTFGHIIFSSRQHFLKAAFTGKYLGGIASVYAGSNDINFGINPDSSLNLNTSRTEYNHNPKMELSDIFDKSFRPDANAFGFDAGIVYEFRGNIDRLSKISRDDHKAYLSDRRDANKYMIRLGVSLLDAGMFQFTRSEFSNNFSANINNWRVRDAKYGSIAEFDTALASRVTPFANDPRNYKVHLPAALSVQLDLRFVRGLYLNLMAYRPIKMRNDEGYRFDNYGFYSITPRWEGRFFGVYIPYTFSSDIGNYKNNLLGASVRIGPLFIGSSNLGTMAFNKNLRAADVYAGLKVGITYGKSTKASRLLEKLRAKKADVFIDSANSIRAVKDTVYIKPTSPTSQLLVDYKTGQVFSVPNHPGSVVIINNIYYGTGSDLPAKDSSRKIQYRSDTTFVTTDSAGFKQIIQRKAMQDSLNMKKAQLDSLIKNLEQLRKSLDSSNSFRKNNSSDSTLIAYADAVVYSNYLQKEIAKLQPAPAMSNQQQGKEEFAETTRSNNIIVQADEELKKKITPGSDTLIAKQSKETPETKATPEITQQTPVIMYQPAPAPAYYNGNAERDQAYNQYMKTARSLQNDIRELQRRNNVQRNGRTTYVPFIVRGKETSIVKDGRTDTLFIKDTLLVRDTLFITDSSLAKMSPAKKDSIVNTIATKPDTVFVPVVNIEN